MAFQSGNPSVVEEIVQEFYSDMKRDLNTVDIVDLMFEKRFIDHQFKRNLEREKQQHGPTKANQVLLDYLIEKGIRWRRWRGFVIFSKIAQGNCLVVKSGQTS